MHSAQRARRFAAWRCTTFVGHRCQDGAHADGRRPIDRRTGRRTARGRAGRARTGLCARGSRNGQDPHDHSAHRPARRERSRRPGTGAGGDIHPACGGGDALSVARARSRRWDRFRRRLGAGADVSRRRAPPAAVLLAAGHRRHRLAAAGHQVRRRGPRGQPHQAEHQHRRRARPRRRDRVGQGIADRPRGVPGRGGRRRPRHPAGRRKSRGRLHRVRGAQGPRRIDHAARLRRPAAAHRGRDRERRRGGRGVPRPLPLLRRRRVPGRDAVAAAGALGLVGRSGRPDRRRRPQPDHLLVHRGLTALPARFLAPVSGRHGGAPGARLPVHSAGGVAGQPDDRRGPGPGRGQQAAADRPA